MIDDTQPLPSADPSAPGDARGGAVPDLTRGYEPREVEARWFAFWEAEGVFHAEEGAGDTRPVYCVPMPPPNVTGSLHMGHALMTTLEDVLVRKKRMDGFNVLYQPGIDHAGIATQTVVERQLARDGKTRFDLGREEFEKRIWAWKATSGGRIAEQQRVLGASADWKRSKFTMDADQNVAVREAFVRLFEEGLIYRATRLINWDPVLRTSLSDLEVDHEENNGELFEFAYKVIGSDDELVVATTRPETMLGDTAVAVHPDDPRYTHLHGKRLAHPFAERTIPVICDAILVDPKFGTGAVKVTPAHDFNDFATGKRHGLEEINLLHLDGTMNENAGAFSGLPRERARTAVKKALDEKGLVRGTKQHRLTVPKSQRSGTVVEPMLSTQWFVKMDGMAERALAAVASSETTIVPDEWRKTYDHFLENIQDWCISRQLWWGHQIPAWHGPDGAIRVARERPAECGEGWTQDPDVLDTWFSSALWPFATLGWPEKTPLLDKFYPASDLETGYDILFFWVARMMMFGIHFMGRAPFSRVLLHGLIVDETGDKMSKVKGNVIDPLDLVYGATFAEVMEKTLPGAPKDEAFAKFKKAYPSAATMESGFPAYGADALRFTLTTFPPSNKRIALAPKRIEGYRHFVNKVWNATRLSLELLGDYVPDAPDAPATALGPYDAWILSRLAHASEIAHAGIEAFRVDEASNELYRFFWYDFCDWYLEIVKPTLRAATGEASASEAVRGARATLYRVLEASLRLLHPMMPYVTEELWQRLPGAKPTRSIALAPTPRAGVVANVDAKADTDMAVLQAVVVAARTIRSEHEVHPAAEVKLSLRCASVEVRALLAARWPAIRVLVKTDKEAAPSVEAPGGPRPKGTMASVVPHEGGAIEVLVDLSGHVTRAKELERIAREQKRIDKDLSAIEKKLGSKAFAEKAPKEVVDEAHGQKKALLDAKARLEEARALAEELD
ncbi:MAG: valine--tRNA ligase [Myxococcales bacterium]|nr:valine--tRNA ligase [Myxococcales bacterium]MBL0196614.1 valine--tRNA ligase [Myxococcales bacterium]